MNNFKKGGFDKKRGGFGDKPRFGGDRGGRSEGGFGGGRDRGGDRGQSGRPGGRMELFPAICSECQKKCEVPFRPTGDKPVYCRDCFNKQDQVPGRNSNGSDGPRRDFRSGRDDRHDHAHAPAPRENVSAISELKMQISALDHKLGRILELLNKEGKTLAPAPKVVEAVKETKTKTVKAKAAAKKVVKKAKK